MDDKVQDSMWKSLQWGGVWGLVLGAGPVVKAVLVVLFLLSVATWAVILYKIRALGRAHRESLSFLAVFRSFGDLRSIPVRRYKDSPLAELFRVGYGEWESVKTFFNPEGTGWEEVLERVQRSLQRTMSVEVARLEGALIVLATAGNTAPFIGLFGTVWGIMDSFHKIGLRGSSSLAVVAPGISEALVATAAGLAVAIPAVVFYNYFVNRVRYISTLMEEFCLEFLNLIGRR